MADQTEQERMFETLRRNTELAEKRRAEVRATLEAKDPKALAFFDAARKRFPGVKLRGLTFADNATKDE